MRTSAHGHLLRSQNLFQHHQCGIALRRSVGLEHLGVYDQSVAVLHQQIPVVTQLRFLALALACQLRIRVRLRCVRVVRRLLPMKVHRGITLLLQVAEE
jgi:hypothetical protein